MRSALIRILIILAGVSDVRTQSYPIKGTRLIQRLELLRAGQ